MSPFLITLLSALFLVAFGGHFLWHGMRSEKQVKAFPRSQLAAIVLMSAATGWFLYKVTQLGPADFGQYKELLFIVFLGTAVGSFFFVPDFLAVRGLAALTLLIAGAILQATYMNYEFATLILKGIVYLGILAALILGASPYKLRDFISWLYRAERRPRVFGGVFAASGLTLALLSLTLL